MHRARLLALACSASLSYDDVGATGSSLPAGYRHVRRTRDLGAGRVVFDRAAERLMGWQVHRRAGLTVDATTPEARVGTVVVLGLGVGRLRLHAPCRVVRVLDEPDRRGFAHGTLTGHPETGEERFEVTIDQDDEVRFVITAFSRPATWWFRLGGPVSRRVQDEITDRYLAALAARTRPVTTPTDSGIRGAAVLRTASTGGGPTVPVVLHGQPVRRDRWAGLLLSTSAQTATTGAADWEDRAVEVRPG